MKISGLSTVQAKRIWAGELDHHNLVPERKISNGEGNPCRHCLKFIEEGEPFFVLSHRPFDSLQPYAEQGPIFLHAKECPCYTSTEETLPPVLADSTTYLMRAMTRMNGLFMVQGVLLKMKISILGQMTFSIIQLLNSFIYALRPTIAGKQELTLNRFLKLKLM